ncbi:thioesterase domain-containing protein [Streptomyces sp. NPDC052109]|uniref:thioesterase II family protein n=1 Tax=Streptomyces sp. NPDC052109 TaxID=3155527 RepID=UPI0034124C08
MITVPRPVPGGPALRLFLFHHAGGSAAFYGGWDRHFPADWELCLLDAPGRGAAVTVPRPRGLDDLAELFRAAIRPRLDGVPYAFFGHSMGALAAYATACRLGADGAAPHWLGVSAALPPGARDGAPRERHLMSDADLRGWAGAAGGTPGAVLEHAGLWRLFGRRLREDLRLVEEWRPGPLPVPLSTPVTAFGGAQDRTAPPDRLAAWSAHTRGGLVVRRYPGGHFYLADRTNRHELVADIATDLARCVAHVSLA